MSNNKQDNIIIDWSKSHCGIMLCDYDLTSELMPEVLPIIDELIPYLQYDRGRYLIDVKVHMLMPEQYPCIPNWHTDFVPRNCNLKKQPENITGDKMYLWVSGAPKTEFKNGYKKIKTENYTWIEFDQYSVHRGTKSKIHTWRCFIRLIPKEFIHNTTINIGSVRRHSQVYIDDPAHFRW